MRATGFSAGESRAGRRNGLGGRDIPPTACFWTQLRAPTSLPALTVASLPDRRSTPVKRRPQPGTTRMMSVSYATVPSSSPFLSKHGCDQERKPPLLRPHSSYHTNGENGRFDDHLMATCATPAC